MRQGHGRHVLLHWVIKRLGQRVAQETAARDLVGIGSEFAFEATANVPNPNAYAKAIQDAGRPTDLTEYRAEPGLSLSTRPRRPPSSSFRFTLWGRDFTESSDVVSFHVTTGRRTSFHRKRHIPEINYTEDPAAAQTRFSAWLERVIVEGLNQWRQTL